MPPPWRIPRSPRQSMGRRSMPTWVECEWKTTNSRTARRKRSPRVKPRRNGAQVSRVSSHTQQ
jgi:hypothetical protein